MDNPNVQQATQRDVLPAPRKGIQDLIHARSKPVDVVPVDSSWWTTRVQQGVHVLNPSVEKLEFAKDLARRLGTYTVYCYTDKPLLRR